MSSILENFFYTSSLGGCSLFPFFYSFGSKIIIIKLYYDLNRGLIYIYIYVCIRLLTPNRSSVCFNEKTFHWQYPFGNPIKVTILSIFEKEKYKYIFMYECVCVLYTFCNTIDNTWHCFNLANWRLVQYQRWLTK